MADQEGTKEEKKRLRATQKKVEAEESERKTMKGRKEKMKKKKIGKTRHGEMAD